MTVKVSSTANSRLYPVIHRRLYAVTGSVVMNESGTFESVYICVILSKKAETETKRQKDSERNMIEISKDSFR